MAIKVTLTNKSQQTGRLAKDSTTSNNDIQISRFIYQQFRSLTKSKVILENYTDQVLPLEFMRLLQDFDDIQQTGASTDAINKLDEYLGTLGVTADYHFSKDVINVEPWVSVLTQEPTRNVIYNDNGVIKNVITNIDGTDYNVVHLT